MRFSEKLKTQSADDEMFLRRSLHVHECRVCGERDLCVYDILGDGFVCSSECLEALRSAMPPPTPEQPIVEPPVVEHHEAEKSHGRSKKA
jgi:hypothetical protein